MNFLRRLALQKKKLHDSSRLDVVEIARVRHASELVSFLVGLRTYQHPGIFELSTETSLCAAYLYWGHALAKRPSSLLVSSDLLHILQAPHKSICVCTALYSISCYTHISIHFIDIYSSHHNYTMIA